jgi:hypothetical protein
MKNQSQNPFINDIECKNRFDLQITPEIRPSFWVFLQARWAME